MLIMDIKEEEINTHIESFLNEISRTINDYNHSFKFKDDSEVCTILNYLFELSGSKLRIHEFYTYKEVGFVLKPVDDKLFQTSLEAYMYYLKFNNDVSRLPNVLKAFKHIYRFQYKYKHLWNDNE